jgi:transcriptional regulator GlxA family with amidase domain
VIPDAACVVRDGNVFTGGGVTAGIDMALAVMAESAGRTMPKPCSS